MKNFIAVIVAVFMLASISSAKPVHTSDPADAKFVSFLEDAWVNAILHKNVNALNHIMADDFRGVSPLGQHYTKGEAISDVQTGFYSVQSMDLKDMNIRIDGDTALVTYYQNEKSKVGNEDRSGRYAFTDVFVKRDGSWRAISSQGTPVVLP